MGIEVYNNVKILGKGNPRLPTRSATEKEYLRHIIDGLEQSMKSKPNHRSPSIKQSSSVAEGMEQPYIDESNKPQLDIKRLSLLGAKALLALGFTTAAWQVLTHQLNADASSVSRWQVDSVPTQTVVMPTAVPTIATMPTQEPTPIMINIKNNYVTTLPAETATELDSEVVASHWEEGNHGISGISTLSPDTLLSILQNFNKQLFWHYEKDKQGELIQVYDLPPIVAKLTLAEQKDLVDYMKGRGETYRIPPEIMLAFFYHESHFGRDGVAYDTASIGNIRTAGRNLDLEKIYQHPIDFVRYARGDYKDYSAAHPGNLLEAYKSAVEDWYQLIGVYYRQKWGLKTIETILPIYAPWGDKNNPNAYTNSVVSLVNKFRSDYSDVK